MTTPTSKPRASSKLRVWIDRCLPQPQIKTVFEHFGFEAWTCDEIYGTRSPSVLDPEWIKFCGEHGLTAISRNPKMFKVDAERDAIRGHGALVVHVVNTKIQPATAAAIIGRHMPNIERWAKDPKAGLWRISPHGTTRDL